MGLSIFVWRHRKAALLLIAVFCVMGAYFSQHLPVAIFPDLTAPRIIVTADSDDTPIPTMLANVTRPLENAVASVPGITVINSLTQRGSDELDVNFNSGTDMQATLQALQAKITQIQSTLPPGTNVQAERLNPSVFPIMGYSLYSNTLSPQQLRHLALYTLRPRLQRVDGVQQVNVMGGDSADYVVSVNPTAMLARNVTVQDVDDALSKTNEIASVGYYDQAYLHNAVLVSGLIKNEADIAAVTVAVKNRVPVTIGQIASVTRSVEPRTIETSGDGHDAVLIDIIKQPNGNTIQIAGDVKAQLQGLEKLLPPGVTVSNFYDQSQIVGESQSSVLEAILVGGLLALIVLMLFLGNLRTAAIVLIVLPLTILISFGLMKVLGQTMNIMTLGALAIALGLVIDDGIVVVESMFHELENGLSRRGAIAAGLHTITPAMVGSSLTTMAAFLPLTFLSGITGQFFAPLAIVMVATLGVSLILSLLLTPILADYLLPLKAEAGTGALANFLRVVPDLFERVAAAYSRLLKWCLTHGVAVLALIVPIVLCGWLLFGKLETGFFPEFDEGGFILDYQLPPGTSLAETSASAARLESILAHTPEVAAWSRRTGAQLGFDITTQDQGDISVRLKDHRTRDIQAVMDDVRNQAQLLVPGAQVDFHQILQDNIGDIAGSPSPVQVKIFGDDPEVLKALAVKVDDILANHVAGVVDDNSGIVNSSPETQLDVNTENAQRFGLTTEDVKQGVQSAIQGSEPTSIQQGEEAVGVRVQLALPPGPLDDHVLGAIPLASPVSGGDVPVSSLATVNHNPGTLQVTRENQRQMIAVTAGLSGRDLGSATGDIQKQIAAQVKLPAGYSIEYGGLYQSQQQSFGELAAVLVTAVLFVFVLLVLQLRSFGQSIALLTAAILSLIGVLLGLFVTKTQLNISSMTGAVMIVGIVTENGIVLFDFFNKLQRESPGASLPSLMLQAGEKRLRPILMTTIGAILALFPLALGLGAGAALQKPLAVAVIGGLCVSTLFTLIWAPVLYVTSKTLRLPFSGAATRTEDDFAEIERELSER